jgi:hypothetical protein
MHIYPIIFDPKIHRKEYAMYERSYYKEVLSKVRNTRSSYWIKK